MNYKTGDIVHVYDYRELDIRTFKRLAVVLGISEFNSLVSVLLQDGKLELMHPLDVILVFDSTGNLWVQA